MAALLEEIEALLRDADWVSEAQFGKRALGDGHLVRQMRQGRELGWANVQKVRAAMLNLSTEIEDRKHYQQAANG
jgi:hypothetical protein